MLVTVVLWRASGGKEATNPAAAGWRRRHPAAAEAAAVVAAGGGGGPPEGGWVGWRGAVSPKPGGWTSLGSVGNVHVLVYHSACERCKCKRVWTSVGPEH